MARARLASLALCSVLAGTSAFAQATSSGWFPVPAEAVFDTGDSWSNAGTTFRLYGVQSCLRGTSFTNAHGIKRDCGEASLAMLVALIRDLRPQCYKAAELPLMKTAFVFCVAVRTEGAGKGSRIDLGTALIATGFAFAALNPDGSPVHPPYLEAQRIAQGSHAGLWAFRDLPDPNAIIQQAIRQASPSAATPPPQ
ncbi:thermonuclease family protein [Rhizobium leguminosarum]|uniref:thermonuclease family protein n=1 Tax=Rhizobium leguminosarum TaxID=384 RepID=UPI001C903E4C|nr:thermonuclease family protein [Rhizobium leguminosarum]MBY3060396.1 thermonuclease family protein [Rhizobium leguminosarum]